MGLHPAAFLLCYDNLSDITSIYVETPNINIWLLEDASAMDFLFEGLPYASLFSVETVSWLAYFVYKDVPLYSIQSVLPLHFPSTELSAVYNRLFVYAL